MSRAVRSKSSRSETSHAESVPPPRRTARRRTDAEPERAAGLRRSFDRFATAVASRAGSPVAFGAAFAVVVLWAIAGPLFGYSDTWQLVINTGTTIITFLMVFLIQQSQNKESKALQMKLDELLFALKGADDGVIDAEDLDEASLNKLAEHYAALARRERRETQG